MSARDEQGMTEGDVADWLAAHDGDDLVPALHAEFARIIADAKAEVVRAVERELDDADQITDLLGRPNRIAVWGVRRALAPFGGKSHRWPVPAEFCAECEHPTTGHQDECNFRDCDCLLSEREAMFGRDEAMDDAITQALWEDAVANNEPWAAALTEDARGEALAVGVGRPSCNWDRCRHRRSLNLPGCVAWCKCRCHIALTEDVR